MAMLSQTFIDAMLGRVHEPVRAELPVATREKLAQPPVTPDTLRIVDQRLAADGTFLNPNSLKNYRDERADDLIAETSDALWRERFDKLEVF